MDLLFLLIIFAILILPTMFMMRNQRKRQNEMHRMQESIQPGDKVINVSGFHGTVVGADADTLDIELAPGMVVTMERGGVLRRVEPVEAPIDDSNAEVRESPETYQ